jgi:bifunctional NMN adenylyltransferase/nudix hydrolase
MDFVTRRAMVRDKYPAVRIAEVRDHRTDVAWSKELDTVIVREFPGHEAILYGSRDSFIKYYSGKFECIELPPLEDISSTALRNEVAEKPPLKTSDFRAGVIYAATTRRAVTFPVVDIAILDLAKKLILLGSKKEDGGKLRFIGGFVDPKDESLEMAAKREAMEETGMLEIGDLRFVGSARIPDWRYKSGKDGLMSSFFVATYVFGRPEAKDDIDRLEWVPLDTFRERLVEEHESLGRMLEAHLASRS